MDHPDFFDAVPAIAVHDPLAACLGASISGRIEYRYHDVVKLAGHSCPTTAGTFLMLRKGLAHLYPDRLPERGAIGAALRADRTVGATGVIGRIVGMITGAAGDDGFKGLGGQYDRRGLLSFGAAIAGDLRLTRLDDGRAVDLRFVSDIVPAPADLGIAMRRALSPGATEEDRRGLAERWQARVRKILLDHRDDPALVVLLPA